MQFFQKNKEQSNQNLNSYNTKDEDSHCAGSFSRLARLSVCSAIICVQVTTSVSLRNHEGGSTGVFPLPASHGISPRAAWAPSARCWDTALVRVPSPEPRREHLSAAYDLLCQVESVSRMSRALNARHSVREMG